MDDHGSRPASGVAPYAAFLGCSAIWGSTFLVISLGDDALPPLWAATIRLLIATPLLFILCRIARRPLPRGAALRAAAGFGFLNFGLSFCLLYWGETAVPSGITSVVYATVPLSAALFARLLGLEALDPLKIGAALVALAGVAVIFSDQVRAAIPPLPLAAVLTAATCASLSGVILKRGPRQDPLGANAAGAVVGLAVCLCGTFLAREHHPLPTTARAVLPIVYLVVAGSIGAFWLYAWLVNHWDVSRISFIAVVVPVVALSLGAAVRHEALRPHARLGSALVLLGLGLAVASDRVRAARAATAAQAARP